MNYGECAYCGRIRKLTRDHVPPRCLFSKPRPNDLITVPCCSDCNRNLSMHDEYFRIAITAGIDPQKFPEENAASIRAINNLGRPASLGFATTLLSAYERCRGGLTIDRPRLEVVLHRIIRGLYYHHRSERLQETIPFASVWVRPSLNLHADGQARLDRLGAKMNTIGRGVFRYAFEPFEPPDPFGTAWLMDFYDLRTFFCVTASEETVRILEGAR